MPDFSNIINKKLDKVILSSSKDKITFYFQDGFCRTFGVEGDCCSYSWIEHLELIPDLQGAILLEVFDSEGIDMQDPSYECLQVYHTVFRTNRGDIILEYRNDSNGYYCGYLVDI